MTTKPSHKELEQRIKELEKEAVKLSQTEAQFAAIIHNSPIPTAVGGSDGSIIAFNEALEMLIGYKRHEIHDVTEWAKKLYPDQEYRTFVWKNIQMALNGQEQECTEFTIICKDGAKKMIDFRTSFFQDDLIIQMIDITKGKQAEEALRDSEKRFHSFLDNLGDIAYEADTSGNVTYANKMSEKITGIPLKNIIGKPFLPLFAKESQETAIDVYQKTLNGKTKEYELVFTNGKICHFKNEPLRKKNGNIVGVFGIARDITDRKRAEEALQRAQDELEQKVIERTAELAKVNKQLEKEIENRKQTETTLRKSEEKYRLLIETMNDGLGIIDENGLTTYVNNKFLEFLGYSKDEIMGRPAAIFFTKNNLRIFKEQMKKRRKGERKSYEIEFTGKEGQQIPTLMSPQPIFDSKHNYKGSFAVITDISALKQTEKALKEKEMELEIKSSNLEDVNTALRVLLDKREDDKARFEENVLSNVKELVEPYLEKLKSTGLDNRQASYVNVLEYNLNDIVSPFSGKLPFKFLNLSPSEIRIANLVKQGKNTKEIAELMNLSRTTVATHRRNIRKKLGIGGKKANLRTHLLSVQ